MTMVDKQSAFSLYISELITWCSANDYLVTLGEAWRSDETAKLDEQSGKGISNSLHRIRLAVDLNIFRKSDESQLLTVDDYRPIGEYWELLGGPMYIACWGGRFSRPDADHFSFEHGGVK